MNALEGLAVLAAGLAAGAINTIVGSGSLVTFPVLLGLGYDPLVANVSNTVGLVPGSVSGVVGYRRELAGQGPRLLRLAGAGLLGGLAGGLALLARPDAFQAVVPALVIGASLLMAAQPWVSKWVRRRQVDAVPVPSRVLAPGLILLCGVYGGYFGAAQGILLLAVLGVLEHDTMQRLNATKNVLALVVNAVAAVLFIAVSPVSWPVVALLASGAVVGGQVSARLGRRIPDRPLRLGIVVFGLAVGALLAAR